MKATLEFDLDSGMYRAFVVLPLQLVKDAQGRLGWPALETVQGYGDDIAEAVSVLRAKLAHDRHEVDRPVHHQVSGPRCKDCHGFTTYTRVNSHGLCMQCEINSKEGSK